MKTIYALEWKLTGTSKEFEDLIPDLLDWLRNLKQEDKLRACGEWINASGGLTLVEAADMNEAEKIADHNPLSKIGITKIYIWEVFFADLFVDKEW